MINVHINAVAPGVGTATITAETEREIAAIRRYHHRGTSQMGRNQDDIDVVLELAQSTVDALRAHGYSVVGTSRGFCSWTA
jgi:hypothetical protein